MKNTDDKELSSPYAFQENGPFFSKDMISNHAHTSLTSLAPPMARQVFVWDNLNGRLRGRFVPFNEDHLDTTDP